MHDMHDLTAQTRADYLTETAVEREIWGLGKAHQKISEADQGVAGWEEEFQSIVALQNAFGHACDEFERFDIPPSALESVSGGHSQKTQSRWQKNERNRAGAIVEARRAFAQGLSAYAEVSEEAAGAAIDAFKRERGDSRAIREEHRRDYQIPIMR